MYPFVRVVLAVACCHGTSYCATEHIVNTTIGDIIGHEFISELSGRTAVRFLGIPYAETPQRFSRAVVKEELKDALNASTYGPACFQINTGLFAEGFGSSEVSEDCLTLNVFIPQEALSSNEKIAVMVFIYGGGFILGASSLYPGDNLALYGDIVVVSLNYRVAAFGFLDFGLADAPANVGLWDIHLALRWVSENVERFGGDQSRVTIFGESAGGAAVTYQMMYKGNRGLFQRAIAESGALGNIWSSTPSTNSLNASHVLAKAVGCNSMDARERLDCMRKTDARKIVEESSKLIANQENRLAPTQDGDFVAYDPMSCLDLTSECRNQLIDVDFMSGLNDFDGVSFIDDVYSAHRGATWKEKGVSRSDFENIFVPYILADYMGEKGNTILEDTLMYRYTDHTSYSDIGRLYQTVDMGTDFFFLFGGLSVNSIYAGLGRRSYLYRFGKRSPFPFMPPGPLAYGANHGDELTYVFGFFEEALRKRGISASNINQTELDYANTMMTYWTNFAKTGDPNSPVATNSTAWTEFNNETRQFMDFTSSLADFRMDDHMYADREAFWMSLLPRIRKEMEHSYSQKGCKSSGAAMLGACIPHSLALMFGVIATVSGLFQPP